MKGRILAMFPNAVQEKEEYEVQPITVDEQWEDSLPIVFETSLDVLNTFV